MIGTKRLVSCFLALGMVTSVASANPVPVNVLRESPTQVNTKNQVQSSKVELIKGNSSWKYEDSNTDMYGKKFYEKDFDSTSWKSGAAPLGYPQTDYNDTFGAVSKGTLVNSINKPNAIISYYFTNEFKVESLKDISKLEANVGIDDGFVMYINGKEVNRSYIEEGEVSHETQANYVNEPSSPEGTVKIDLSNVIDLLVEGENKIAVSVHNRDSNSSDIYFDMNLIATYGDEEEPPIVENEENKIPKQVNAHMGDDASTQVNLTYTTIAGELETKAVLNKVGDSKKITVEGENTQGNANKYFHKIAIKDLEPNTRYEYTIGSGNNTFEGSFKTAPKKGSKDSFKFAYIADPQVANATDAEAAGATFAQINKIKDLSFVYMAGDITNTATSESQWELLFNNGGAYPTGGQDLFSNNLISAVQGNHDNNTLTRHINAPAEAGNIVYSYDYGPATFIMLNLEAARTDATARAKQREYLEKEVSEAKEKGQWTFVGFHKSIYTGASHITDSDIIEARKYWSPIFSELDVDVVMQGHDHVYSRGFVNEDGYNANPQVDSQGKVINPENAPLYMVGGHAGGLKWYSKKNYTVGNGDPLAPAYSFLDVNSTDTNSDVKKEQVMVEFEVEEDELKLNTYMFKYNPETDTMDTEKYLYDTLTIAKNTSEYQVSLGNVSNVEGKKGTEFKVPMTVNAFPSENEIRSSEIVVDIPNDLEVKDVELNNKAIKADNWDYNVSNGKLRIAMSNTDDSPIFTTNISGDKNIANITLSLKEDKKSEDKTKISVSQFTFRCNNDLDIEYDLTKAISNISFAQKEVISAYARELYISEGTDVIPTGTKAVAVEFTSIEDIKDIKFNNIDLFYNEEFTSRNGKITYVALVPENTSLESLSNIDNYTLTTEDANLLSFGDIKNDGIDAQDALKAVSAWLRKTELNDKDILTMNVSSDGKVNTRDAIDIVDNYVDGKEFKILSK